MGVAVDIVRHRMQAARQIISEKSGQPAAETWHLRVNFRRQILPKPGTGGQSGIRRFEMPAGVFGRA